MTVALLPALHSPALRACLKSGWFTVYPLISTNPRESFRNSRRLAWISGINFDFKKAPLHPPALMACARSGRKSACTRIARIQRNLLMTALQEPFSPFACFAVRRPFSSRVTHKYGGIRTVRVVRVRKTGPVQRLYYSHTPALPDMICHEMAMSERLKAGILGT